MPTSLVPTSLDRAPVGRAAGFADRHPNALNPPAKNLLRTGRATYKPLQSLEGRSLLSAKDLNREQVLSLCRLAAALETHQPAEPLKNTIAILAFFEASTRTRLSFASAALRLGGQILSIDANTSLSLDKGECLSDTAEMLNSYGDLLVMRHRETDAITRIVKSLSLPAINAGNGTGEHPTQALLDWYAILKWMPALATPGASRKLHLGVLGNPKLMRTVKSFLLMSLNFLENISRITVIADTEDTESSTTLQEIQARGKDLRCEKYVAERLRDFDVIYINSVTYLDGNYQRLEPGNSLDIESNLKKGAVILHPLARLAELDVSLDNTPHNLYFCQAAGAVAIRQALLLTALRRLNRLQPTHLRKE